MGNQQNPQFIKLSENSWDEIKGTSVDQQTGGMTRTVNRPLQSALGKRGLNSYITDFLSMHNCLCCLVMQKSSHRLMRSKPIKELSNLVGGGHFRHCVQFAPKSYASRRNFLVWIKNPMMLDSVCSCGATTSLKRLRKFILKKLSGQD